MICMGQLLAKMLNQVQHDKKLVIARLVFVIARLFFVIAGLTRNLMTKRQDAESSSA